MPGVTPGMTTHSFRHDAATAHDLIAVAEAAFRLRKARAAFDVFGYRSAGNAEEYDAARRELDAAALGALPALAAPSPR